jgi:hypothetical protein
VSCAFFRAPLPANELAKIQEEQNVPLPFPFNAIIHREIQNQPAPFI